MSGGMQSADFPPTWVACKLGDVTPYGATKKVEPSDIPLDSWVLELEDIEKDTSRILQRVSFRERKSKSTKNRFEPGDVLYGKLRPYLNKVVVADEGGYCTTEIIPLKATQAVESRYLFYWLKHPVFLDYVTEVSHGLNMPRLGTDAGKAAPFILAPLAEQKRIADKLEAVLGRVDACRARLDRVPALLKRFRQSVLAAATSGKLSEEWREENQLTQPNLSESLEVCDLEDLPSGWTWTCPSKIKLPERYSLSIGPFGSNLKVSDYQAEGVPLVFVREIRARAFGGPKTKFVMPEKAADLKAHSISGGDLLITKMGDPPGDVAIYPPDSPDAIITADCIKLTVDPAKASAAFIGYTIESPQARERLQEIVAGVAQQKISLERFRDFPLPLPPLPEQQEIVRRVEALFAFADRIEARLATARKTVERLTPATLAKAFRGELVPQDPNDEPASAILERLHAQIDPAAAKPKRGRAAKSTSA